MELDKAILKWKPIFEKLEEMNNFVLTIEQTTQLINYCEYCNNNNDSQYYFPHILKVLFKLMSEKYDIQFTNEYTHKNNLFSIPKETKYEKQTKEINDKLYSSLIELYKKHKNIQIIKISMFDYYEDNTNMIMCDIFYKIKSDSIIEINLEKAKQR